MCFWRLGWRRERVFVRWFGRSFGAGLGSCYLHFVLNTIIYMRVKAEQRWLDGGVMVLFGLVDPTLRF
ncbi:hypothetical protein VTJ04DRAFT_1715 [Mycothermus thermophilus]|uniref:uncharacterized protein n=1 Tax=Humicola insolens TaxID=85995 RepID=UPI003742226B